ncbi:MAG TPA: bifunctional DNA-formamidopyrimidine glycosylase/DNA-(apurinic or apyrimidinic site) lyase, partial [Candidatus Limnocylindrales bacterium]
MPELPEVETIARELRPLIEGRTIESAWFDWPRQIKHPSPDEFVRQIRGRTILSVDRRAKWIVVSLTGQQGADSLGDEAVLAIQVKMTGYLHVVPADEPADKHVHFRFRLDNGQELRMRDARKFGRMGLHRRNEAGTVLGAGEQSDLFAAFGPEPLDDTFTLADFRRRLRRRKARLKTLLMDQGFVAGVGNIYADEALWRARLHPLRSGAGLNPGQERELYDSLRSVLREGIERRGSSVDSYRAPAGAGNMQHFLNVYGRTG